MIMTACGRKLSCETFKNFHRPYHQGLWPLTFNERKNTSFNGHQLVDNIQEDIDLLSQLLLH